MVYTVNGIRAEARGRPPTQAEMTVWDAVELWLRVSAEKKKRSTCSTYRRVAEKHIKHALGGLAVTQLTREAVSDFLNRKVYGTEGEPPLSGSTVCSIVTVLRGALEQAEKHGVPFSCWDALETPRRTGKETRVLAKDEWDRLEKLLKETEGAEAFGILLCMYTGLRIGELCALRWGDISADGLLTVRRTVQRILNPDFGEGDDRRTIVVLDAPKSRSSCRIIPLPKPLLAEVEEHRCGPDYYVLTSDPRFYMEPRTLQHHFKHLLQMAGVEDVNFHALRHTFATKCVQLGCDPKTLSLILGHSDVSVTLNTYVHPSMAAMRSLMERLAADF
ncbi:MAG: site-specific integrase [Clostridiales bacterium]|nr:site-specific integrase [Clostridiales bacterium]